MNLATRAEELRLEERHPEALEICFRSLTENQDDYEVRLTLARIFFDLGFMPFAIRELQYLRRALPANDSIKRLLERLSPGSSELNSSDLSTGSEGEGIVSETEFEIDLLETVIDPKRRLT